MTSRLSSIPPVPDPQTRLQTSGITLDYAVPVYDWLSNAMTLGLECRLNKKVIEYLCIKPPDLLLDVGCATGGASLEAARFCDQEKGGVIGLDASSQMIKKARTKVKNLPCRFDTALAESMPYADGLFDKVISTFFFHHLNRQDKSKTLKEIWRVLKPSGIFIVCDLDAPCTLFGNIYGKTAELFFRQPEIGENLNGVFQNLLHQSAFENLTCLGHYAGCFSIYKLTKPASSGALN